MAASTHVKCTCEVCTNIRRTVDQIFRVLDVYGWILDSYVVDFFQENLEERLSESWRSTLGSISLPEFGAWIAGDISCRVWPLSLMALRRVIGTLQLNRDHTKSDSVVFCGQAGKRFGDRIHSIFERENEGSLENLNDLRTKCYNLFMKHVKKKKRYEIEEITKICANCAQESSCQCIVDIGAGMGHLARALAFRYGLFVTCIEQEHVLSQQARKCDEEFLMSIRKHLPHFNGRSPQHISAKLKVSDDAESELIERLQETFQSDFDGKECAFGLVGLHPCGDLAATLLKLYSLRKEARFICIVGCCYMKLTLECKGNNTKGYPLSEYLRSNDYHKPSYTALEVACHAIEKYCDKLKTGNYEDLKVHAYRAALETILTKKDKRLRHSQVKNVKVTKDMSFEQYCIAATGDLDQYLRPEISELNSPNVQNFLKYWKQVVIFGSLRLMLAPLIETVILLDRFLFLSENNLAPVLKPVFDARLSPRNFVLISAKDEKLFS